MAKRILLKLKRIKLERSRSANEMRAKVNFECRTGHPARAFIPAECYASMRTDSSAHGTRMRMNRHQRGSLRLDGAKPYTGGSNEHTIDRLTK